MMTADDTLLNQVYRQREKVGQQPRSVARKLNREQRDVIWAFLKRAITMQEAMQALNIKHTATLVSVCVTLVRDAMAAGDLVLKEKG
jgi:hypothetical protein